MTLDLRTPSNTLRLAHNQGGATIRSFLVQGPPGMPGVNAVPADQAVAAYLAGPSASHTALASAIAADSTVAQAAAVAVNGALVEQAVPATEYDPALATDELGFRFNDGVGYDLIAGPTRLLNKGGALNLSTVVDRDFTVRTQDPATGVQREPFGVTERGRVFDGYGSQMTAGPDTVTKGDSITAGALGNGTTWPNVLQTLLSGRPNYLGRTLNYGIGGETSRTILARTGGSPFIATVSGGSIPASGGVTVTLTYEDGTGVTAGSNGATINPLIQDVIGINPVTIVGDNGVPVEGTLSRNTGTGVFTFTRNNAGTAVPSKVPHAVITWAARNTMTQVQIIAVGQNDGGTDGQDYNARYDRIQKLIDRMPTAGSRFLVQGVMSGGASFRAAEEAEGLRRWGRNFVNMRAWMSSQAVLDLLGVTATANDLDAMSTGNIPPSLLADANWPTTPGVHPNATGYTGMAYLYFNRYLELGWVN